MLSLIDNKSTCLVCDPRLFDQTSRQINRVWTKFFTLHNVNWVLFEQLKVLIKKTEFPRNAANCYVLWLKTVILIHVEASTCLTVFPSLDLSGHIAMLHNSLSSVSSMNGKKNHFLCYSFCFCAESSIIYYALGLNICMANL